MTGKHRSTRRQTCPNATFGYQVRVTLRRTVSRSVRLGVEVPHDQICCCVSLVTPPPTMYTKMQFIPHREHNLHSKNQSVNAAHRNYHCLMWGIIRNTRTHCVGRKWRWTPVICGQEFLTYFEDMECRGVSSPFRRGVNEILALVEFYEATLVVWHRRFGTNFRSHLQGPSSPKILEYGTDWLSRNVGNYLQIYAA
jgi:hypothetical protein